MTEEAKRIESMEQLKEAYGILNPLTELGNYANHRPTDKNFWIFREAIRMTERQLPKFGPLDPHVRNSDRVKLHFLHVSKIDPLQVVYIPDDKYGTSDRHVRVKPGKYLKKFFGDHFSDEAIAEAAANHRAQYAPPILNFVTTADEIERVYTNGPGSCMAHSYQEHFRGAHAPYHPVRVYEYEGTGLAFVTRDERITARAMVNLATKEYGRVYGDAVAFNELMLAAGYAHDINLPGLKLQRVPHPMNADRFLMPYIDGAHNATDMGDYLELDPDGEIRAGDQHGNGFVNIEIDKGRETLRRLRADQAAMPKYALCSCCNKTHIAGTGRQVHAYGPVCPHCWEDADLVMAWVSPTMEVWARGGATREINGLTIVAAQIEAFGYCEPHTDAGEPVPIALCVREGEAGRSSGRWLLRANAIDVYGGYNTTRQHWVSQVTIDMGWWHHGGTLYYPSVGHPAEAVRLSDLAAPLADQGVLNELTFSRLNDAITRHIANRMPDEEAYEESETLVCNWCHEENDRGEMEVVRPGGCICLDCAESRDDIQNGIIDDNGFRSLLNVEHAQFIEALDAWVHSSVRLDRIGLVFSELHDSWITREEAVNTSAGWVSQDAIRLHWLLSTSGELCDPDDHEADGSHTPLNELAAILTRDHLPMLNDRTIARLNRELDN